MIASELENRVTDLGALPQDWGIQTLSGLGGNITSGSRGWAKYYSGHGDLFIRITNLRRENIHLDLSDNRYVFLTEENSEAQRTRLRSGDLLVSITADIGIIGYVDENVPAPAYINQHIARVRLDPQKVDTRFVAYYLASWRPQREFVGSTDTGAKAGMNLATVGKLQTVVPPLAEQKGISDALDECDDLIATIERLITKKQAVKQGMMQQLLTGKTHLPGFTAPWRERPFGEISTMKGRIGWQGLTQDEFTTDSRQPFLITGMNFKDGVINWSEVYHVSEDRYAVAPEIQLREHDVLMTKDGTIGKLLYVGSIPSPGRATLNSHLLVFRPRNGAYVPRFLYYQLASPRFVQHIELHKSGSTFFGISQASVAKYGVLLPPIAEQHAIAAALTDIDKEIDLQRERLKKTRDIKRGMMQQLLTGRIRLLTKEAVA